MKLFILGAMFVVVTGWAGFVVAQEPASIDRADSVLDASLISLRDSVARLMDENKLIAVKNKALRDQVKVQGDRIKPVQNEKLRLEEQLAVLEAKHQKKMEGVSVLQGDLEGAQHELTALQSDLSALNVKNEQRLQQERPLMEQADALRQEVASLRSAKSVVNIDREALRQQKLALQKDIKGAAAQLEKAQADQRSLETRKIAAVAAAKFAEDQAVLQASVDALRAEVDGLQVALDRANKERAALTVQGKTKEDVARVSKEVMNQEMVVTRLRLEVNALSEKKPTRSDVSNTDRREEKLRSQNNRLAADVDHMRSQMVQLDKQKASLEKALY